MEAFVDVFLRKLLKFSVSYIVILFFVDNKNDAHN